MLVQFSVKNYRSFKDKVTLSLEASKDTTYPDNIFEVPVGKRTYRLLKSAVIYGANASGKSNLISALQFMTDFVFLSTVNEFNHGYINFMPFKLNANSARQPSEFEIVIIADAKMYTYGFTVDKNVIYEEWLTVTESGTKLLFERKPNTKVSFGSGWKGERKRLIEMTRDNSLFLTVAAQFNHPVADIVRKTITDYRIIDNDTIDQAAPIKSLFYQPDESLKQFITNALCEIDVGIEKILFPDETGPQHTPFTRIETQHMMNDGTKIHFDYLDDESQGTKRIIGLLMMHWYYTQTSNMIIICDELDTHLHPHLMRFLIKAILETPSSQLIFTTHDCTLLDANLFRRDQIWFTEKDQQGATDLYSLWDFKVRKEENYRMGYLIGRYGAIPFIGDLHYVRQTHK